MSVRQLSVEVPNPSDNPTPIVLRLEPVPENELARLGFDLPPERLSIRAARITTRSPSSTLEGCLTAVLLPLLAFLSRLLGRSVRPRPLRVQLPARTVGTVHVSIDVTGPRGAAALKLVDRRGGEVVGGVTILIVEPG